MFALVILIPLTMITVGIIWSVKSPEKINSIYGYRTRMSMLNKETWDFAHRLITKIWLIVGFIMLILSVILYIIFNDKINELMIICILQIVLMLLTIIPVEIALYRNFDKKGNKK